MPIQTHPLFVAVDSSRFPGRARAAYLESFRTRRMDHQFHYDTERQAQLWLTIHEAFSPARTDPNCLDTYEIAFRDTASMLSENPLALISFGCGGGQKDATLLKHLHHAKIYVGADVSPTLALVACLRVRDRVPVQPFVLDLSRAENLPQTIDALLPEPAKNAQRLFAFFGMLPNFETHQALNPIISAMRPNDLLLLSANLAPGSDYRAGVQKILPQYDNPPTRRWLPLFLSMPALMPILTNSNSKSSKTKISSASKPNTISQSPKIFTSMAKPLPTKKAKPSASSTRTATPPPISKTSSPTLA